MPGEGFTARDAGKDKGSLVYAETGESITRKEDRSYTKKQILFSQRQKNDSAAQNTDKVQCVRVLYVRT